MCTPFKYLYTLSECFFPSTECKINPSPGRCSENEKRTFYSFSNKVGGCVEIYGCYTINDRNVWYTRHGCKRSCLVPKPGAEGNQNNVAAGYYIIIKEMVSNTTELWRIALYPLSLIRSCVVCLIEQNRLKVDPARASVQSERIQ